MWRCWSFIRVVGVLASYLSLMFPRPSLTADLLFEGSVLYLSGILERKHLISTLLYSCFATSGQTAYRLCMQYGRMPATSTLKSIRKEKDYHLWEEMKKANNVDHFTANTTAVLHPAAAHPCRAGR